MPMALEGSKLCFSTGQRYVPALPAGCSPRGREDRKGTEGGGEPEVSSVTGGGTPADDGYPLPSSAWENVM